MIMPVPPRDCGPMQLRGTTYTIKADKVRCTTARRWSRTYVLRRRAPRAWRCRRPVGTRVKFTCRSRDRTFFGIRRG
jgi:hypothetical protein